MKQLETLQHPDGQKLVLAAQQILLGGHDLYQRKILTITHSESILCHHLKISFSYDEILLANTKKVLPQQLSKKSTKNMYVCSSLDRHILPLVENFIENKDLRDSKEKKKFLNNNNNNNNNNNKN